MSIKNERSLDQIKTETEATRAQLTGTVNELRSTVTDTVADIKHQFSPATMKKEVGNYVRSRGETIVQDIADAARRNPMQAVAIGAGVAYPLLRLARAIPLPIALIGAGYFLAGTKRGRDLADSTTSMVSGAVDQASNQVNSLSEQVKDSASSLRDTTTEALTGLKDKMSFGQKSPDAFGLSDSTKSITDTLQQTVSDIPDQAKDAYGNVRDTAQDAARRTGEMVQQNPLLVAGLGLLVGGLIASLIPKVKLEEELMGDASAALGGRAREAVDQGYEQVKEKAESLMTGLAAKADEHGLSGDELANASHDLTDRIQKVAERGVHAALGRDNVDKSNNVSSKTEQS